MAVESTSNKRHSHRAVSPDLTRRLRAYRDRRLTDSDLRRTNSIYIEYDLSLEFLSKKIGHAPSWWSIQFRRLQLPTHSSSHRTPGSSPPRRYRLRDPNAFRKIDTPEKAFLVGFLFADAKPLGNAKRLQGLQLTIGKRDSRIFDKLCSVLGAEKNYVVTPTIIDGRRYECLTMTIYSVALGRDLAKLGIVPGRTRKNIPPPRIPEHLLPHFVRGLIDGDGWITRSRQARSPLAGWSIGVCGSASVVSFAQKYAARLGIPENPMKRNGSPDGPCWKANWHGIRALRLIEHLYKDAEHLSLPRKYEVARAILDIVHAANPRGATSIPYVLDARGRAYMTIDTSATQDLVRLGKRAIEVWKRNWHPTRGRRATRKPFMRSRDKTRTRFQVVTSGFTFSGRTEWHVIDSRGSFVCEACNKSRATQIAWSLNKYFKASRRTQQPPRKSIRSAFRRLRSRMRQ